MKPPSRSGYRYEDQGIELFTDFECGNGCNPRRVSDDVYALDLEPEPGTHRFGGKSYYFCCGLRNRTAAPLAVRLRLYGSMNGEFGAGTRSAVLRLGDRWQQLAPDCIRTLPDSEDTVELLLDLPAGVPPLYVSNFHWHSFSDVEAWTERLRQHRLARVSVAGHSAAGRPLYRIDLGREEPDAPTIVMSQTPQPSEGIGTHVCRAIVEWLLGDDAQAAAIRAVHRVIVVPATNPDGTVLGLGVSHPSGRFPYFEGKLTAEGAPDALPEMRAMWELLTKERPWWFIEWHGNNWARRPGHMLLRYRPHLLSDPKRRALWERIDDQLLALPDTHHGNWTDHDEGMYQISIGFQAVTRLGCIAHMIKHHDRFPLEAICRHAIACFSTCVNQFAQRETGMAVKIIHSHPMG